jgi:hypothetical protein
VTLNSNAYNGVPKSWILLDNQSTIDIFYNKSLLTNICENSTSMEVHFNAGVTTRNMVGDLDGYGTLWYHPTGIANIISLANKKDKGYHVTFDNNNNNSFNVNKLDGTCCIFTQSYCGLYYLDTNNTGALLLNTVIETKSNYTKRDYNKAVLA